MCILLLVSSHLYVHTHVTANLEYSPISIRRSGFGSRSYANLATVNESPKVWHEGGQSSVPWPSTSTLTSRRHIQQKNPSNQIFPWAVRIQAEIFTWKRKTRAERLLNRRRYAWTIIEWVTEEDIGHRNTRFWELLRDLEQCVSSSRDFFVTRLCRFPYLLYNTQTLPSWPEVIWWYLHSLKDLNWDRIS